MYGITCCVWGQCVSQGTPQTRRGGCRRVGRCPALGWCQWGTAPRSPGCLSRPLRRSVWSGRRAPHSSPSLPTCPSFPLPRWYDCFLLPPSWVFLVVWHLSCASGGKSGASWTSPCDHQSSSFSSFLWGHCERTCILPYTICAPHVRVAANLGWTWSVAAPRWRITPAGLCMCVYGHQGQGHHC